MSGSPLEAAFDELYGADPGEFVALRKRLAASLRADGDKAAAKLLSGARRPSTAAWALNQLARREHDVIEQLLDAGRALYAAQTRGSKRSDALRDAIRAHRDAIEAAAASALESLGTRANDSFRGEIVSTLRAVGTDEELAELLRTGRLVREASSSGFPDAVGLKLVPDLPAAKPTAKAKPAKLSTPQRVDEQAAKAAARAARELEAQQHAAAAERVAARKDLETAEKAVVGAQARVHALQHELEAARRELTHARSRSRAAKTKLRDLR